MSGNGRELKEYRQKIMTAMLNYKYLCELVLNDIITTMDDSDLQDRITKNYIFKFAYIPDTQEEAKTYITFDITSNSSASNDMYKNVKLTMNIICHKSLIDHPSGYLRSDMIDECLQDLFNDNYDFGVGKMTCVGDSPIRINNTHYGRQIDFVSKEFNTPKCGGR